MKKIMSKREQSSNKLPKGRNTGFPVPYFPNNPELYDSVYYSYSNGEHLRGIFSIFLKRINKQRMNLIQPLLGLDSDLSLYNKQDRILLLRNHGDWLIKPLTEGEFSISPFGARIPSLNITISVTEEVLYGDFTKFVPSSVAKAARIEVYPDDKTSFIPFMTNTYLVPFDTRHIVAIMIDVNRNLFYVWNQSDLSTFIALHL